MPALRTEDSKLSKEFVHFFTFLTNLALNTERNLVKSPTVFRPSGDNIAISSLGQKLTSNSSNVTGSF